MKTYPVNVRIAPETQQKIEDLAERLGLKQSELMRLAMSIGLDGLDTIKKTPADLYREEVDRMKVTKMALLKAVEKQPGDVKSG